MPDHAKREEQEEGDDDAPNEASNRLERATFHGHQAHAEASTNGHSRGGSEPLYSPRIARLPESSRGRAGGSEAGASPHGQGAPERSHESPTPAMAPSTFFEEHFGQPIETFLELDHDQRAGVTRNAIPDLHWFFDAGKSIEQRDAPSRTRELALSLYRELASATTGALPGLAERIVTDGFLRSEADRDQNVYFGALFTRVLTRATPDVIFQPASIGEASRALRWARHHGVPVTLRGAASTAMGGAVPNDGGVTLDLSRLDEIEIGASGEVCVVGAGARLRTIHQRLAERGLALRCYPSNLGGTLAGWFVTGGIGLNTFSAGPALESVRAADVVLPGGEHVRFHDDGRLDVPEAPGKRRTLPPDKSAGWFESKGYPAMTLADLAGSEGVFGLLLHLTVAVEPRPAIGAFLLSFDRADRALEAAAWVAGDRGGFGAPANLKFLSASHLHHARRVWEDDRARTWRERPSAWSNGSTLPWSEIVGPASLGASCSADHERAAAYLFVDFHDLDRARRFVSALSGCPGAPRVLDAESVRFAAERFRPQQSKRLGPGLIAAEIRMPAEEVPSFLPRAARLARQAGQELESEVYYLADGGALVIAGYLTDHTRGSLAIDLMIAPALLDLGLRCHRGRPYVLGRWQSPYLSRSVGRDAARRVRAIKRALDTNGIVNRGVVTGLRLRGVLGALVAAAFVPGVRLARFVFESAAIAWIVRAMRSILEELPGPAAGRGAPAAVGARFVADPPDRERATANGAPPGPAPVDAGSSSIASSSGTPDGNGSVAPVAHTERTSPVVQPPEDRALHCVNCGECNSVCPIFHESRIRLPQMLTHLGETVRRGRALPATGSVLLDLCMRCGNCEEVCQAGIPHLPLYQVMQRASDRARPPDRERHASIVASVRGSARYTREFLNVRPGGYHKRSPAALPGMARFVVLRAENDAGPAATCIHCGACVAVCPTHANRDLEAADPRWITTSQDRCIGCGSCVEVCPANHSNGGQTLRVMEAPARDFFVMIERFEREEPK